MQNTYVHVQRGKLSYVVCLSVWGTAAAAPLPFRPGNPVLCGSCPLVTPYYCRLGDLLCYTCMLYLSTILCVYAYVYFVFFVFSLGGTAAAAPPPSGLATLPSVGAVP